jgi:hypothetical protein
MTKIERRNEDKSDDSSRLLTILPVNVLRRLMSNYLTVKDISQLDIAFCKDVRFLEALKGCTVQEEEGRCVSDDYLYWVGLRQIKLTHLDFVEKSITDQTVRFINAIDLSNLISINGEFYVDDDTVIGILQQCNPSLTKLDISNCDDITDRSVILVANRQPQLKEFILSGNGITGDSLIELSKHLKELEYLQIWGCGDIERSKFEEIYPFPNLIHFWALDVDIDDLGLNRLAICCPSLRELLIGFSGCLVTDDGVISLVKICGGTLDTLHIIGASQVTDKSLTAVANHCPQLYELDFGGCSIENTSTFKSLAQGCKKLEFLSVLEQPWVNIKSIPTVIYFLRKSLRLFSFSDDVIACVGDEKEQNQYFDVLNRKFPNTQLEVL